MCELCCEYVPALILPMSEMLTEFGLTAGQAFKMSYDKSPFAAYAWKDEVWASLDAYA